MQISAERTEKLLDYSAPVIIYLTANLPYTSYTNLPYWGSALRWILGKKISQTCELFLRLRLRKGVSALQQDQLPAFAFFPQKLSGHGTLEQAVIKGREAGWPSNQGCGSFCTSWASSTHSAAWQSGEGSCRSMGLPKWLLPIWCHKPESPGWRWGLMLDL